MRLLKFLILTENNMPWESKQEKQNKQIIALLERILLYVQPRKSKGGFNMLKVVAGQGGVVFTFLELDQNGKAIAPLGPINFVSTNPKVFSVDNSQQVTDPSTFITTVPVTVLAANPDGTDASADMNANDPATANNVSLKDTLVVSAVVGTPIATSATGGFSLTTPATGAASKPSVVQPLTPQAKNPLALS